MSDFLAASACRGRRPGALAGKQYISRPHLVLRLLQERSVARFLIAPDGFGKTSLLFEYAHTMQAFAHLFWINAKSPCFLRDLDKGILASCLLETERQPFMAVFEDLPFLEAERAEKFSHAIDVLLEAGHEVLIACVPSADVYTERQKDRIVVGSSDMLLSAEELARSFGGSQLSDEFHNFERLSLDDQTLRIPALMWGKDDGSKLLAGVLSETLPADIKLTLLVSFVLQQGSWEDYSAFVQGGMEEVLRLFGQQYPFVQIDSHEERFAALQLSVRIIAKVFSPSLETLGKASLYKNKDELILHLAEALLVRNEGSRACELVTLLASKSIREQFVLEQAPVLLCGMSLFPLHEVCASLARVKVSRRNVLKLVQAWNAAFLDDSASAQKLIASLRFAVPDENAYRVSAALLLWCCGEEEACNKLLGKAELLLQGNTLEGSFGNQAGWRAYVQLLLALRKSTLEALELWSHQSRWMQQTRAGIFAGILILMTAERHGESVAHLASNSQFERLVQYLRLAVEQTNERNMLLSLLAATSLLKLYETSLEENPLQFSEETQALLQIGKTSLEQQRSLYREAVRTDCRKKEVFNETHPDPFRKQPLPESSHLPVRMVSQGIPQLSVNLFGGLQVSLGKTRIDLRRFQRNKSKTLLAILVLNRGREVSRDKLVRALWPESPLEVARKNFYSVWSQLRRTLTCPDGTCPYLVREQDACRLNIDLVESDIVLFEAICRTLFFGQVDASEWKKLFLQINEQFSEELLPGERNNELIIVARNELRMRLVDALVTASHRLIEVGEIQPGLWFAHEALKRDSTREDCYVALMQAQMAAGRRTSALETYFKCRRYLAEELGIDPSAQTVNLYREIIETENAFEF